LKRRHPREIFSRLYTKPEEGRYGADWEWWFTDAQEKDWLGLRAQAKVLQLSSNQFPHLHYKKNGIYQSRRLKRTCKKLGLIPLYCLYTVWRPTDAPTREPCGLFTQSAEDYGCSLVSLNHIELLRDKGEEKSLLRVIDKACPWHCLVCESFGPGKTLPQRAWAFLQNAFGITTSTKRRDGAPDVGITHRPPPYVRELSRPNLRDTGVTEFPDAALRGLVLIREARGESL
jgi:hypothetical protein